MYFVRASFFAFTEQHFVSIFFTRLWSVRTAILFMYIGRLAKMHFVRSSIHFCWLFGLVFMTRVVDNPEIST